LAFIESALRPSCLPQQLRQLGDIAIRRASSFAAVLFSHDLTLSEGFKEIRQGFGLFVA
jgi:hypothetical protein